MTRGVVEDDPPAEIVPFHPTPQRRQRRDHVARKRQRHAGGERIGQRQAGIPHVGAAQKRAAQSRAAKREVRALRIERDVADRHVVAALGPAAERDARRAGHPRFAGQRPRGPVVRVVDQQRARRQIVQEEALRVDVVLVGAVKVGMLARHDGGDESAVESQPVHPFESQRMRGDLDDHAPRSFVAEPRQPCVQLWRRRGRQPASGLREATIPHAQRSDDRRLEAAGVQQSAQDFARARLAERPREADDRQIAGGMTVQSRREEGKRAAGRGDDQGRHARRHTVGPLDRHSRGAVPDGLLDERMPVVHRTRDRDEQRARRDAPAVFRDRGDLGVRIDLGVSAFWPAARSAAEGRRPGSRDARIHSRPCETAAACVHLRESAA